MKMTRILKKLIALVFAGMTFVSVRGNALASEKETVTVLPTTTIEQMVDEVNQEEKADLMLTEEEKAFYEQFVDAKGNHFSVDDYESYLTENGIKTIDGNIIIETIEDFEAIVQYYKNYLCGFEIKTASDWEINDRVLSYGFASIPKEVIQELASSGKVNAPFKMGWLGFGVRDKISKKLGAFAAEDSSTNFITDLIIIFDKNIRECVIHEEQKLQEYISSANKKEQLSAAEYLENFDDFFRFLNGQESNFPSNISSLDPSAKFIFYEIAQKDSTVNAIGGGIISGSIASYNNDSTEKEALKSIEEYTELLEAPVKTK